MEKKINWSLIASVLFGLVLTLLGWIVQYQERRLTKLEEWRESHESYHRDYALRVSAQLATIETKLDRLIQDQRK